MSAEDRSIRRITTAGLLLAVTLLLVFTRLGMIPVPTPAANATIAHIPAILGGILEGPLVGLVVGLGFGFGSFASATTPLFKDPVVAILPRLFIGVTAAYAYYGLRKAGKKTLVAMLVLLGILLLVFSYQTYLTTWWLGVIVAIASLAGSIALYVWLQREDVAIVALGIASAVGTLTNTVLVLTMAVLRGFLDAASALVIGVTHGIPEVIVAGVVVIAVVSALRQVGRRRRKSSV